MKMTSTKLIRSASILMAAGLLGAAMAQGADVPATATPPPNAPPNRGGGGGGGGGKRGMAAMGNFLDDQQLTLLRENLQKQGEARNKIQSKMMEAQKALMQAVLAEKQDDAVLREKADAVAKLQAEMTVLMAKAFAPVIPTLKPEQRDTLEKSPFALNMLGGMGGGMGRAGMGGGMGGGMGRGGMGGGMGAGGAGGQGAGRPNRNVAPNQN